MSRPRFRIEQVLADRSLRQADLDLSPAQIASIDPSLDRRRFLGSLAATGAFVSNCGSSDDESPPPATRRTSEEIQIDCFTQAELSFISTLSPSPDGRRVTTTTRENGALKLWSTDSLALLHALLPSFSDFGGKYTKAVYPTSGAVLVASVQPAGLGDTRGQLWSVATGDPLETYSSMFRPLGFIRGDSHILGVRHTQLSPGLLIDGLDVWPARGEGNPLGELIPRIGQNAVFDGTSGIVAGNQTFGYTDDSLVAWSLEEGRMILDLRLEDPPTSVLHVSRDRVWCQGSSGTLSFVDLPGHQVLTSLPGPHGRAVAAHDRMAASTTSGALERWLGDPPSPLWTTEEVGEPLALSPGGRLLTGGRRLELWDFEQEAPRRSIELTKGVSLAVHATHASFLSESRVLIGSGDTFFVLDLDRSNPVLGSCAADPSIEDGGGSGGGGGSCLCNTVCTCVPVFF